MKAVESGRFESRSKAVIHCLQRGLGHSLVEEIREMIRGELRAFRPQQAQEHVPNPKRAALLKQMRR
jgi:Arc/MetJ-type ribon-helix-helix transcriptional regulator